MKIFIKDWMEYHPYKIQQNTDRYYIKLANELCGYISDDNQFDSRFCKELAIQIASYLEDVISGFGIWKAFTTLHKQHFGKFLPFYDVDEENYYQDEINFEDVRCLIWMSVQKNRSEGRRSVVNPKNPGLHDLAMRIYKKLDREFENAPINELLEAFFSDKTIYNPEDSESLNLMASLVFNHTYLFRMIGFKRSQEDLDDYKEQLGDEDLDGNRHKVLVFKYLSDYIYDASCGPLSLPLYEWLNVLVPDNRDAGKPVETAIRIFKVLKADKKHLQLESVEGKCYDVISAANHIDYKQGKTVLCTLISFNGAYAMVGPAFDAGIDIFYNEKEKLCKKNEERDLLNKEFFKTKRSNLFYGRNISELNDNISTILDFKKVPKDILPTDRSLTDIVGFMHSKDGIVLIPKAAKAIAEKGNVLYDPAKANEIALGLLLGSYGGDSEFFIYLVRNNLLPDLRLNSLNGEEDGRKLLQENLEFMFRFFQPQAFDTI